MHISFEPCTSLWSLFLLAAGNAFCQAAQLHIQLQNKHDAATSFVDAGNAFKKADPQGKRGGKDSRTISSKLWGNGLTMRMSSEHLHRGLCGTEYTALRVNTCRASCGRNAQAVCLYNCSKLCICIPGWAFFFFGGGGTGDRTGDVLCFFDFST